MNYDKKKLNDSIECWRKTLENYRLPSWDELPAFELYMDQVIVLMNEYLKIFIAENGSAGFSITPPMINNYVKLKVMPAPQKKKYSKIHLAYLIMICSLKRAHNLPVIQKIIPLFDNESEIKSMYEAFVKKQEETFAFIADKISSLEASVTSGDTAEEPMPMQAVQTALCTNIFKVITEDIVSLPSDESEK